MIPSIDPVHIEVPPCSCFFCCFLFLYFELYVIAYLMNCYVPLLSKNVNFLLIELVLFVSSASFSQDLGEDAY